MTEFNKRTVLAAIAFMRHVMMKRLIWAGWPIVGSQARIDECIACLDELGRAEREVRAGE